MWIIPYVSVLVQWEIAKVRGSYLEYQHLFSASAVRKQSHVRSTFSTLSVRQCYPFPYVNIQTMPHLLQNPHIPKVETLHIKGLNILQHDHHKLEHVVPDCFILYLPCL